MKLPTILKNDATVVGAVGLQTSFQFSANKGRDCAIVVDLIDIKTNETKHLSSDMDFVTIKCLHTMTTRSRLTSATW